MPSDLLAPNVLNYLFYRRVIARHHYLLLSAHVANRILRVVEEFFTLHVTLVTLEVSDPTVEAWKCLPLLHLIMVQNTTRRVLLEQNNQLQTIL